ncbi:MAG: hypothetical protein IJL02_03805 [Methanobrevibacter sp.]|uniref:phage minor head protein n=1 Tax=Methanobrevibacter sp. TaxID=66852 RepID=UPI0025EC945E|nr:phage minor head protein [Methanobrevibacter sp.]MBQ6098969.1 hypothetical protein [Methanobrevibacter sp.]
MIPNLTDLHIPNDKKLSRGEQEYLRRLLSGLDNQMLTAAEWLGTQEAKEFFNTRQSEIREFFQESGIRQQLRDIIDYNAKDSDDLIKKFYQVGSQLGYRDIHKKLLYTPADKKALYHVTQYNFDLIRDLNTQLFEGIQETIFNTVAAGNGADVTAREILNLGIKPLPIKNEDGEVVRLISPRVRARMIARTEHARAVNTGTLQAYSNYGVEHVEIITVGDSSVCDICLDLQDNNPYTLQEAMALLPAHPNCYDDETEVYTKSGWKLFKDVTLEDDILTLNPETKLTEFVKPVKLISYPNPHGYMYLIHNKWFNCCVTPDHDCFVYQRRRVNGERDDYPEFHKPDELNSESKFLRIVENDKVSPEYIDVNGLKFTSQDYAFFMAWYLSEGSILHNQNSARAHSYPIKITQMKTNTREILEKEFKRISEYLGIKLYVGKDYFEFHSKQLHDYLKPFGYSYEKYVPEELFELSRDDLKLFLDMYVKGDGHKRGNEQCLFTSSKQLIDDLSYVSLLAGYNPTVFLHSREGSVVEHRNGVYTQNHDVYGIRLNNSKYAFIEKCNIDKIDYDGNVYCIELPKYHTLWVKRNNQTSWNGNCRCSFGPVVETPLYFPEDNPVIIDLTQRMTLPNATV